MNYNPSDEVEAAIKGAKLNWIKDEDEEEENQGGTQGGGTNPGTAPGGDELG